MSDAYQGHEPAAREPQAPTGPPQPTPDRILILEDSPWDAELAQRLLTSEGLNFSAVVVETKAAFLQQLAPPGPDIIISDYSLPGFTGTEALLIVQEQHPEIPFICWSGVLGDETAVELIKLGATDYVLKDRPARLPSAVSRALLEARQRSRLAQIEGQLGQAQRLASLGHLGAAEEALSRTHQMLADVRGDEIAADPSLAQPSP
jgi:DNA-binding NtrC family response regulator